MEMRQTQKKKALLGNSSAQGDKDEVSASQNKVGKKLSDLTTRRVIILVLMMLCSVPMFSV